MKLAILILFALASTPFAQAKGSPILPGPKDGPTCYKREYTAEHLRKNPQQLLEAMYLKISRKTGKNEYETWNWISAEVVGVNRGEFYGNTAGCAITPEGKVECGIECDGGSFSLSHSRKSPGSVNFMVTKGYYFPLFKNHMSYEETEKGSLSLKDEANRIYRVIPAEVRECDEAIQRTLGLGEGGC